MKAFNELVGKTFKAVTGLHDDSDEIVFMLEDGTCATLYHEQDCCERVRVYDVAGDVNDLVGTPIVLAEEVSNADGPDLGPRTQTYDDSQTWTFYRIGTVKGTVVVRWLGESNGYYSERVSFTYLGGVRHDSVTQ